MNTSMFPRFSNHFTNLNFCSQISFSNIILSCFILIHFDQQILEGETEESRILFPTFGKKEDDCWLCGCFISQALDSRGTIVSTLACR